MEGITILETIALTEYTTLSYCIFFLGTLIYSFSFTRILLFVAGDQKEKKSKYLICGVIGIILCICSVCIPIYPFKEETGKYQYKCEIDETTTIGDIEEQYNIIEVQDSIWTLEDK